MDDSSFSKNISEIKKKFAAYHLPEEKYSALIELGRSLPHFEEQYKTADRIVQGCQSKLYLRSYLRDGKIFFEVSSDALISAGLAALLILAYNGEPPETVLKCPPLFMAEIGVAESLSLNRSNGLAYIHLRMKQEAVRWLAGLLK